MVLAAEGGAPRRAPRRPGPAADERGSQSIELVLALPLAVLALLLVVAAGLLGADAVAAQGLARDLARTAAVGGADEARAHAARVDGREVELRLRPADPAAGDRVVAEVRLRSPAFERLGVEVWLPAEAAMRAEGP